MSQVFPGADSIYSEYRGLGRRDRKWCQPPNLGKWRERDRRDPPAGRLRRVGLQPERGEGRRPVQAPSERPDDRSTRLRRRARERRAGRDAHGEGGASCRTRSSGV